jgi:hypothetical protein
MMRINNGIKLIENSYQNNAIFKTDYIPNPIS